MTEATRIVVPTDSQDRRTWFLALAYAVKQCSDHPDRFDNIVVVVHTQQQVRDTVLGDFVGKSAAKALLEGRKVPSGYGPSMSLATKARLPFSFVKSVVIAYFAEDRLLEQLDGIRGLAGIVAVPDHAESVPQWIERWNPKVHGAPEREAARLLEDPVVERALLSITRMVNLGTGLAHPRDKELADQTLRILRAHGHKADAKQMKSWAIKRGWQPKGAEELAVLGARILTMATKPSLSKIHDPDGKYRRWSEGED